MLAMETSLVYMAAQAGGRISVWFFRTADHKSVEAALRSILKPTWSRV
jgi:hypothetical protein